MEYLDKQIKFHSDKIKELKIKKANLIIQENKVKNNRGETELGKSLEDRRLELRLTIKELCLLSDISPPAYRAIITGSSTPRQKTINRIKGALDCE